MSVRDTHFRTGFAHLLWQEIEDKIIVVDNSMARHYHPLAPEVAESIEHLIAVRAYDLLIHDRMHTGTSDLQHAGSTLEAEEMVNGVPDLREWPDYG